MTHSWACWRFWQRIWGWDKLLSLCHICHLCSCMSCGTLLHRFHTGSLQRKKNALLSGVIWLIQQEEGVSVPDGIWYWLLITANPEMSHRQEGRKMKMYHCWSIWMAKSKPELMNIWLWCLNICCTAQHMQIPNNWSDVISSKNCNNLMGHCIWCSRATHETQHTNRHVTLNAHYNIPLQTPYSSP